MIVYGLTLSPYVKKVLAFAGEKPLPVSLQEVPLQSTDPEFREASPFGKMPALRDGSYTLSDSTAIVMYLEEKVSAPRLIPIEPQARGRTIWFDEFADTILNACVRKIFFNRVVSPKLLRRPGDEGVAMKAETEELPALLEYLEASLDGKSRLVGDELTLADIAVASVLANLSQASAILESGRHPRVTAFAQEMTRRPSFSKLIAMDFELLGATGLNRTPRTSIPFQ